MQVQYLDNFVGAPGTLLPAHPLNIAVPPGSWETRGNALEIAPGGAGVRLTNTAFSQAVVKTPFSGALDSYQFSFAAITGSGNGYVFPRVSTTAASEGTFSGIGITTTAFGFWDVYYYYDGGLSVNIGSGNGADGAFSFDVDINVSAMTYATKFNGVIVQSGSLGVVNTVPYDGMCLNIGGASIGTVDDVLITYASLNVNPVVASYDYVQSPVVSLANFSQIINPFGILPK